MENTKPTKKTRVTAGANAYGDGALELSGVEVSRSPLDHRNEPWSVDSPTLPNNATLGTARNLGSHQCHGLAIL